MYVSARPCMSRRCAQPARHVDQNPLLPKCPNPLPRGNQSQEARYPRRRDCTSDSGGFINGDDILGGLDLDLLGANLGYSDDGQALPTVLCNLFSGRSEW